MTIRLLLVCLCLGLVAGCDSAKTTTSAPPPDRRTPSANHMAQAVGRNPADEALLDEVEQRSFRFFWEQADSSTGLVADRASADGGQQRGPASIASVGFGLTGICIADERGWITHDQAYQRTLTTLKSLNNVVPNEHGFYYHFVDPRTGARDGKCELSSIDTALLMAGVLSARQHFAGTEVPSLATTIYERVDWPWMLDGGTTFSMGWTPENGFLSARWDSFSEHMILEILAMASPTHSVPPGVWRAWARKPLVTYDGKTFMQCPPLFTHQYSHAWVDFRGKRDAYADYWRNSQLATLAQRQFCMDLSSRFPGYGPSAWGITSSDGPDGYKSWGGPLAPDRPAIDGTIVPCAPAGSLPFAPNECLTALAHMKATWGDRIWKRYGFVDAFNPTTSWTDADVIGIDQGITLLMAENLRSGCVWATFMANPEIGKAMRAAGFRSTEPALPDADVQYLTDLAHDTWNCITQMADTESGLPRDRLNGDEWTSVSNIGLYLTDIAAAREMGWISAEDANARLDKALTSLEKCKTWLGFQQCWNSVKTLAPASHDTWVSVVDSGNLAGGLVAIGHECPQFRQRTRQLLDAMDWAALFDAKRGVLYGGYNTATHQVNPEWHVDLLGADSRLAAFMAVASGKVPATAWSSMYRSLEERDGVRYLTPGWQGGGLFMQYINGLWLDERGTFMGRSAENFAYAQMIYADRIGAPVWGWSACAGPEGKYLGWGGLKDAVVTPHASSLAVGSFPREVVANLHALEARGARRPGLGFVDSIDWQTGKMSDQFLLLDQSMLMLSLVNYLHGDCIRAWFQSDQAVQRGREQIADFHDPRYGPQSSLCELDVRAQAVRPDRAKTAKARHFDDWRSADWQVLDSESVEGSVPAGMDLPAARFAFAWDDAALHFVIRVTSKAVLNTRPADKLYEQDAVELFIDPQDDGLHWSNPADFQFGFAVPDKAWEWFAGRTCQAKVTRVREGYVVEAAIPWKTLGIAPAPGRKLGVSAAVHAVSGADSVKLNWSWHSDGELVRLGTLELERCNQVGRAPTSFPCSG